MLKAKKINIADTNIANLGTELEKNVKREAAKHEKQWIGAGSEPGLQIWRIEKFKVVPWPRKEYGNFFSGDSYIVLHTYRKKDATGKEGDALAWDVFFWLGTSTTQDESGTAAYKTVELDDVLGGAPVQHREVEGYESKLFLSLFPKMTTMDGGVDSGFNHVEPERYRPRLLWVKGTAKTVVVKEVPLSGDSLNGGDVFVLDNGTEIWQWNGQGANGAEKQKGSELGRAIRDERAGTKAEFDILDQGAKECEKFWSLLGGKPASIPAGAVEAPADEHVKSEKVLFRLSDGEPVAKKAPAGAAAAKFSEREAAGAGAAKPDAAADAERLHKALKKLIGFDDEAVIEVLGHRTTAHMRLVQMKYKEAHGKDLTDAMGSKIGALHKDLSRLCRAVLLGPTDLDVYSIKKALEGVTKNELLLTEVICFREKDGIKKLSKEYEDVTGGKLVSDVQIACDKLGHGDFKGLMGAILNNQRDPEDVAVDASAAEFDAKALFKAGEGKFLGTDEKKFIEVFSRRSFKQLKEVCESYDRAYPHTMEKAISRKTSGNFKNALLCIVAKARGQPAEAHAHNLRKSMKGLGTNDRVLVYVMCQRMDSLRAQIKEAFYRQNGATLTDWIKDDTSGAYEKLLLAMLGDENVEVYAEKYGAQVRAEDVQMQFTEVARGSIKKSMLDSSDAFIFDTGFQVYVWIGKDASKRERATGLQYAQYYLNSTGKPVWTPISRVLEMGENELFESLFDA